MGTRPLPRSWQLRDRPRPGLPSGNPVEKVLIGLARELDFGHRLIEGGVEPNARTPFDASTWIRLEPLAAAPQRL